MNTRTLVTTSVIALAFGLAGCSQTDDTASSIPTPTMPTPIPTVIRTVTPTPTEDLSVLVDYKNVARDISDLLGDFLDAADDENIAEIMDLGSDIVLAAKKGLALNDIPDAGSVPNDAWDEAMHDYLAVGGFLQIGMAQAAGESLDAATTNIQIATVGLNAAGEG